MILKICRKREVYYSELKVIVLRVDFKTGEYVLLLKGMITSVKDCHLEIKTDYFAKDEDMSYLDEWIKNLYEVFDEFPKNTIMTQEECWDYWQRAIYLYK